MARHRTVGRFGTKCHPPGLTSEHFNDHIHGIGLAMLNLELKLYPTACFLS